MERITDDMAAMLREPLPTAAITKHPTKTYLSSIKAIYVTERLNKVFGIGAWTTNVEPFSYDPNIGMVVVKLTFNIPHLGIHHQSFGGNDNGGVNNKNFDLGDAYKGATTDALTKICSFLEIGIDVFKGFGSNPTPPTPQTTVKSENWLTPANKVWWDSAVDKICKGEKSIDDIKKTVKIRPEHEEILKKQIIEKTQ